MIGGLPKASNGKIDRRALPAPKGADGGRAILGARPRTQQERTVAGIWATVLGRQDFGIDDNFFDLGGHSLRLARVLALLKPHSNRSLGIIDLFQHTTIRSLAGFALGIKDDSEPTPIKTQMPVYRKLWRNKN
jgi:hypothetical protein